MTQHKLFKAIGSIMTQKEATRSTGDPPKEEDAQRQDLEVKQMYKRGGQEQERRDARVREEAGRSERK